MSSRRVAVVDVGSNSTRLLLAERVTPDGADGERHTVITGLRRGAGVDGTIADDAIARFDAVLAGYAERIAGFAPAEVVAVGTSAVRDAPNRARVEDTVVARLGAPLHVIAGEQEAALAFRGARAAHPEGPALVIDIGGGSTELVCGDGTAPPVGVSLQRGAVRCTEAYLGEDPPTAGEREALRRAVTADVADALDRVGRPPTAIGVAGTFTTLAAIDLGRYDPAIVHGHRLGVARLAEIADLLAGLPLADRLDVPGLHPGRAPFIVAGSAIALAAVQGAGVPEVVVSERDILDGIALAAADGTLPFA